MDKQLELLELLITAHENQRRKGNLTETGKAYLDGLSCAYSIILEDKK